MKKVLIFCSFLFLAIMIIGILPVNGEERIYDDVIRLHVIASSDSKEDQALKLKVRDAVLCAAESITDGCDDYGSAMRVLEKEESLSALEEAARAVITDQGYEYEVSVTLTEEHYPRRSYDSLCFPSGSYTSLRVLIGDAVGANWWCVLFPELCFGAASESAGEKFIAAGFTPEQYKIVTDTDAPRYEIRFKILELLEEYVN
jgi:stage II sporulation protein R